MPEFPPVGREGAKKALIELGYTKERAQKIDTIEQYSKASMVTVGPLTNTLQVTADDKEFVVVDTSQLAIVNQKPHGLFGWIDVSDFVAKAPDSATVRVIWIIDGKVKYDVTFSKSDFAEEPYIYLLERRGISYHIIKLITSGSGASETNPINFPYGFTLTAGLFPIPP